MEIVNCCRYRIIIRFGLQHGGTGVPITGVQNKYQYNGKEFNDELGLNELDYGGRFYDASRAQWTTLDPLADTLTNISKSPYAYVSNNPIRYVDPDGRIEKDSKGNVIFVKNGNPQTQTHPSGNSAMMQSGFIYANDGTKIDAYKNVSGDAGWNTNCHGTTFADGQVWINNDQVDKIIKVDNYVREDKKDAKSDDVVTYNSNGEAQHSVTVTETNSKTGDVTVYGQGGLEVQNSKKNVNEAWPDSSAKQNYYKKVPVNTDDKKDNTNTSQRKYIPGLDDIRQ